MKQLALLAACLFVLAMSSLLIVFPDDDTPCRPECVGFTIPAVNTPTVAHVATVEPRSSEVKTGSTSVDPIQSGIASSFYTGVSEMEVDSAFNALLNLITSASFLPFAAAFVVTATALFKKVLPTTISSGAIALGFQVVVWVAWVLARKAGVDGVQFQSAIDALNTILGAVVGLVGSSYVATRAYSAMQARDVPILGAQRKKELMKLVPSQMRDAA